MTGFVASSTDRYSGPAELEILVDASAAPAIALVERRVETFLKALDAGFFFSGARRGPVTHAASPELGVVSARLEVENLPRTAFDVLSGLLLDCVYNEVFSIRSARAMIGSEPRDLLVETFRRPAAASRPPFRVRLPTDYDLGNNTLLVEIEFVNAVPEDIGERLLEDLALLEDLWLAYPLHDEDDEESVEPVESLGAQRHFNDPRTIHHHEWAWDADPASWNLIVNLCCAWHRTIPVARLHIE